MKLTNTMITSYLMDCLGYDEMMIDELKEGGKLIDTLSDREKEACIDYYR